MTKSKTRICNIEFSLFDVVMTIFIMTLAGIFFALMTVRIVNSPATPYLGFERDYNDCLQSEIFAENECYDIAYTAAFGE